MKELYSPLISVVIPTYNHGDYLSQALQSVFKQTYKNWEIIIIDNYSKDNTSEIVENIDDPRITYLKARNQGVIAKSRNVGIHFAKGEWIAFLDSDDWWSDNKLQFCVDQITDCVDLIYHDLEIFKSNPGFFRRKISSWKLTTPILEDLLLRGNAIATSSTVIRAGLLKRIGGMSEMPGLVAAEDYHTWLCISQLTEKFKYVPKCLGFYREHALGVSRKDMSGPVYCAVKDFLGALNSQCRLRVLGRIKYLEGRFYYLKGDYSRAMKIFSECIKNQSFTNFFKVIFMYTISIFLENRKY